MRIVTLIYIYTKFVDSVLFTVITGIMFACFEDAINIRSVKGQKKFQNGIDVSAYFISLC